MSVFATVHSPPRKRGTLKQIVHLSPNRGPKSLPQEQRPSASVSLSARSAAVIWPWASSPAARGSVVILYATGEGQRNPAGVTGVPAPAYASPVLSPVTMTVGGAAATLAYAASAPGFVGLMQINLTVPEGTATGAAMPVTLTIGTAQSPSGVTIAVQ